MDIDEEIAYVVKGYLNLSETQQKKFLGIIEEYHSGRRIFSTDLRESVHGSVTKMQTGPYHVPCTCCGK